MLMKHLSQKIEQHLFGHILPFWTGPALDHQNGGWLPWISNDGTVDWSQPKGLIVNCRLLWAFSAVYRARPEVLYRDMARRAFGFVMDRFWDEEWGGGVWRLNASGKVLDATKKTYGQAFYIYALTEYFLAFGDRAALDRAIHLFELLEHHAYDSQAGGYWEVRERDWSEAADTRLSEKDMNEKKSMNNHLHVLEAYTNLARVWSDPRVKRRLAELLDIFTSRILDPRNSHFHHFFDEAWKVRSDTYTFGHDIEGSWLLCEAAEQLGEPNKLAAIGQVALSMAEAVLDEALDRDGGLVYEGRQGRVIDAGKECWPQAEALVGFLNAYRLSSEPRYLAASEAVWNFIETRLADHEHGEWFWRIEPDGRPNHTLPKASEWKGPYHGTRACLEALRRLHALSTAKPKSH